ncbi:hypothetical protein HMPREF1564_3666 [Providencia alcalifaciens R90-1475]|nr:hypothetical protein HMPREF1564_3666 [Providencia alcalifaciens R90-1475]
MGYGVETPDFSIIEGYPWITLFQINYPSFCDYIGFFITIKRVR